MEIEAQQSKTITVDISERTANEIAINQICKLYDITVGAYIKEDRLVYDSEPYSGSHAWCETIYLRDATDADAEALVVIEKLEKA